MDTSRLDDDTLSVVLSFLGPRELCVASTASREWAARALASRLWWPLAAARWHLPPLRRAMSSDELAGRRWAHSYRAWHVDGYPPRGRFTSCSDTPVLAAAAGARAALATRGGAAASPLAAAAADGGDSCAAEDATGARGVRAWASVVGTADARLRRGQPVAPAPYTCLAVAGGPASAAAHACGCVAVTPLACAPAPPRGSLSPTSQHARAVPRAAAAVPAPATPVHAAARALDDGAGGGLGDDDTQLPAAARARGGGQLLCIAAPDWVRESRGSAPPPLAPPQQPGEQALLSIKVCVQNISYHNDALLVAADAHLILLDGACVPAMLPVAPAIASAAGDWRRGGGGGGGGGGHGDGGAGDEEEAEWEQPPLAPPPAPRRHHQGGRQQQEHHQPLVLALNGHDEPPLPAGEGARPAGALTAEAAAHPAAAAAVRLALGASAVLRMCFPFPARADAAAPFEPEALELVASLQLPVRSASHPHAVSHTLSLRFPRHRVWATYQQVNQWHVQRVEQEL